MVQELKAWAKRIKIDILAIYIAARDPRTSWYAKAIALAIAAYAISPIDLIPDFIPVLGYLDDLIILPLGIMLVVKLIPSELMAEYRAKASMASRPRRSWIAVALIGCIWIGILLMVASWGIQFFS